MSTTQTTTPETAPQKITDIFGSVKSRRKPTSNLSPDNATIKALYEAGKSTRQIEAIMGTLDHSTIALRLKHLTPRKSTEIYKSLRADIFAETQRKVMMRLDVADPKNARDMATTIGILYDKERLERGLSSANVSVQVGLSSALSESIEGIISRTTPVSSITLSTQAIDNTQHDESVCVDIPPKIPPSGAV